MTCRMRCFCCHAADHKSRFFLHRISGLGPARKTEPEITRLDLLPPNFVENHFGNLIKTSGSGSGGGSGSGPIPNRELASVRRSVRSMDRTLKPAIRPKVDPRFKQSKRISDSCVGSLKFPWHAGNLAKKFRRFEAK